MLFFRRWAWRQEEADLPYSRDTRVPSVIDGDTAGNGFNSRASRAISGDRSEQAAVCVRVSANVSPLSGSRRGPQEQQGDTPGQSELYYLMLLSFTPSANQLGLRPVRDVSSRPSSFPRRSERKHSS